MLKRFLCAAALFVVVLSCATPYSAATGSARSTRAASVIDGPIANHEAGVQFTLPKGWKAEPDGETILITSEDSLFTAVMVPIPGEAAKDAEAGIDEEIAKFLDDVHQNSEKVSKLDFNGIEGFQKSGTGRIKKSDVEVAWTVNLLHSRKPVFLVTYAVRSAAEKNLPKIKQFIASIGPCE